MSSSKLTRKLALITAACITAGASMAQSPTTLKSAVERAVLQHPEVKLRFHNLEAAHQDYKASQGAWMPRIDLETGVGTNQLTNPSFPAGVNYPSSRATLQLKQTIFDGFATINEVRRLSYGVQTAYFELISASNQAGLEAARAYIDVLRFRQLVNLAGENFTTHQKIHDRISQKVAVGVGRRVDLEQASGRLSLAESNWLTEVTNLHDVSARYQRMVGDIPAETLTAIDPLDEFLPIGTDFLIEATKKNPEFLAAVSTIRAYRADSKVRKAAMYPTLEFRAKQYFETNQNSIAGDYKSSALEMVLNYNIFKGGADTARIKQYVAKLESAFALRDKACGDVWQTGQIAFNDSIRLVAQLKLLSQHELATSKARQAYIQQFEIGQRSLLDLLDTENELYSARRSLVMGEHDLQLAEVRVLATSGSLLSALKLQTLTNVEPETVGGTEEEDDLMRCSTRILPALTLNRTFDSGPTGLPPDPSKPTPVVPSAALPPNSLTSKQIADACAELPATVTTWLGAWNNKDFSTYIATYAENFKAAKGLSRTNWEQLRRTRINKSGNIQTTISQMNPVSCDAKNAEIAFTQSYESANYRDEVEKTLSMERVQGAWKIVLETVTKGRTF
jgi:adhesin transport system outer membrane protein